MNVIIRFPGSQSKRRALGKLASRFSGKSWLSGEMMVPGGALPYLATEGISFSVDGLATGARLAALDKAITRA
jgi:hypothetical protein